MSVDAVNDHGGRYRVPDTNLNELKDMAALLTMAGEYLCEEAYLKKVGLRLEKNVGILREYVEDLKKQLVGKKNREYEPPIDDDLKQLAHVVSLFQKTDKTTKYKCIEGELGEELCVKTISLTERIDALKDKVEGRPVQYSKTESALGMFSKLKVLPVAITGLFKFTFKMLVAFILICLIPFIYLYFSMDKEEDLLKNIRQDKAFLSSEQAGLSRIKREIGLIREEIARIKKQGKSGSEKKIGLMNLNLQVYKLMEEQEKAEDNIRSSEKTLKENSRRLEELKNKTFMERLLEPIFNMIKPLEKRWNEFFGA